ncbi:hypothetical protein A2154_03130, partial [Candidatus Gottesmanbacteria bacterium RBG_16_43_7]
GQSVKQIVANLAKNDLIRSPTAFYLLVKLMGLERTLQAGTYRINKSMTARDIAVNLTHGRQDTWITTLEGWRVEEIATELTKNLGLPESEFLKYAVEGYMFPDTYSIPKESTAAAIANIFLDTFNRKITQKMKADAIALGLSFEDVVILASLVEREGKTEYDRPIIAGILLNRLQISWPLQVDASLQYILGYQALEKTWWKKNLQVTDKDIDSKFNTYKYPGLPPAPISNPGLSALMSVIYPARTSYMYYLHDSQGDVHFAATLEEHNQNIDKYLH